VTAPNRFALALTVLATANCLTAVGSSARPPVALRVVRLVDTSRVAHFSNGTSGPRVLVTYLRYPTRGRPPFPLVVFAHGFALAPQIYARLLDAWARAGFVVAAPAFPVENAGAPGGPSQSDLLNEPRDLSFVLTRLLAPGSRWRTLIDPHEVAFAGQSDGAVAALAASYDPRFADRRVDAAMILSGAAPAGFTHPARGSPPLLAVQGTADPINPPADTSTYFGLMNRPKFLLWLLGASHLPPYTSDDRWAGVVERATIAFLDHTLRDAPLRRLLAAGTQAGLARLSADP
jgi:dienelactone hydrolase